MRAILNQNNQYSNVKIESCIENVSHCLCDMTLLCTVFHELDDMPYMVNAIKNTLKNQGILAIIEFHKKETPMGPPVQKRLSDSEVSELLCGEGFVKIDYTSLGDNFYCLIFRKAQ